jgi:hypothetical protein
MQKQLKGKGTFINARKSLLMKSLLFSQSLCALMNPYDELYHHKKEKSFGIHDKSILRPVHLHAFLS